MKKIILLVLTFILGVVVVGGYFTVKNLDVNGIVKQQIEKLGYENTGRKVSVGKVDIKLTDGIGNIKNITMANPSGHKYKNVIELKHINLSINVSSITQSPKIIKNISANGITIYTYMNADGSIDIDNLKNQINRRLQKQPSTVTSESSSSDGINYDPNITVKNVSLNNIKVIVDVSNLNKKVYTITLAEVKITNIGGKNGLPASKIGGIIISSLVNKVVNDIKRQQEQKIKKKLEKRLKKEAQKLLEKLF